MYKAAVLFLLFLPVRQVPAADINITSAEDLLGHCRVYTQIAPMPWGPKVLESNTSVAACLAYLSGVINRQAAESGSAEAASVHCMPADITPEQLAMVLVRYAELSPTPPAGSAEDLVELSLARAWPCR